jgi:hypothetical protein
VKVSGDGRKKYKRLQVSRENPSTVFQISWGEPNAERSGGAKPPSTEAVKKGANFLKKPLFF